jgi:predicted peroxiredoxin
MLNRTGRAAALTSILIALALLTGCACTHKACGSATDGVFVHISSGPEDPHRVLMGLQMAKLMAEQQDVLVYFDIKGIQVVVKNAPDLTRNPFGSSRARIRELIDQGVPVYACPGCLKSLGKTPADLMAGVQVANREAFFNFTKGRILTIDY